MVKMGKVFLVLLFCVVAISAGWAAVTLDDVAKDVTILKVAVAELTVRMDSLDASNGRLFTLMLSLFGIIIAILSGMAWTLINISKDIRVPKEERVSKLEAIMEKVKDHLKEIDDKLHIPRSVLVFLIGISLLCGLTSASWAATLDDVAKGLQQLQIGQAELKARVDILLMLYGIFVAVLAGMVWALIGLSKEVRIPKEERVSKLEVFMEKVKDHLKEIDDKLHIPRSVLVFLVGISLIFGLTSASWAAATLDEVAKGLQQLQIGQARLEARFDGLDKRMDEGFKNFETRMDERLRYLDWKLNLMLVLVISILGFVFYLAKEIGFGVRERVKELFARLQVIEEKIHIPHIPKSVFLVLLFCVVATTSSWAVPNAINVQGRLTNASGPVTDTALETTFTIYRAGTVAWSDTYNVNYQNGLFNQIIEESSGHLFPLFVEDAAYTLGVTIGSGDEMTPR
ncbi:hypothetical protein HZB07_06690, partial [Candidatus Saganbacteria bacterium]|nr:hypothetical protein [Candidatus Saganbacteria bacterium]